MLPAMLIAMLTAITVWWLLIQRLKEKPWTQQGVVPTSQETFYSSAPKVGLCGTTPPKTACACACEEMTFERIRALSTTAAQVSSQEVSIARIKRALSRAT